jgi:hypothetical protein
MKVYRECLDYQVIPVRLALKAKKDLLECVSAERFEML